MIFDYLYNTVFVALGHLIGFIGEFCSLDQLALEVLMLGGNLPVTYLNAFTGQSYTLAVNSWGTFFALFSDIPVVSFFFGIAEDWLTAIMKIVYDTLFYVPLMPVSCPIWIIVPFAFVRCWLLVTIVKWVLSLTRSR